MSEQVSREIRNVVQAVAHGAVAEHEASCHAPDSAAMQGGRTVHVSYRGGQGVTYARVARICLLGQPQSLWEVLEAAEGITLFLNPQEIAGIEVR